MHGPLPYSSVLGIYDDMILKFCCCFWVETARLVSSVILFELCISCSLLWFVSALATSIDTYMDAECFHDSFSSPDLLFGLYMATATD